MAAHAGAVCDIVCINQTSFVSVSADKLAIVWKDGQVQRQLVSCATAKSASLHSAVVISLQRNNLAVASLLVHANAPVLSDAPAVADPLEAAAAALNTPARRVHVSADAARPATVAPATTPVGVTGSGRTYSIDDSREGVTAVPSYILAFAQTLRDEKKLSPAQVIEHLVEQGHSQQIVDAVRETLGQ